MDIEKIAEIAHQVNKAYCESIGDYSQKDWIDADDWQRESSVSGVKMIKNNPGSCPGDSHQSWLMEKEVEGWVYGKVKDVDKKQHPCCVEFSELPREQKAKDFIFTALVKELLK
jgi:hypothetical protein